VRCGRYLVQVVNKPYQVIALKVRHALLILFPVQYVAELVVKIGGGLVETVELLQGRG
jgi:hypothetical protein